MTLSNPTIDVRSGEELDSQRLDKVLREIIPELQGSPSIQQYASGASNLTYLISYSNRELVLRRPPPGVKAASAHSMIREYRVISALGSHPIPQCRKRSTTQMMNLFSVPSFI